MQLTELPLDYQRAVRDELLPGEQPLWLVQPDVEAISRSLLPYSVIWLSGLFLMSAALLNHAPGDTENLLGGLIFVLVIVALVGVLELIFVPRRAARTVYVVTPNRVFSICVTKKLNVERELSDEKRVLKEDPSSVMSFYLLNLPVQLLLVMAGLDLVRALNHHFDVFFVLGFGLILAGWTVPWFSEMRFPLPRFREAPRVLYSIHDSFITVQSLAREQIRQVKIRRIGKGMFTVCLVSHRSGCLRLRAVADESKVGELMHFFPHGIGLHK